MYLLTYLLRRLCYALFVLLGSTSLVFILFNVMVDDPAMMLLGKYASKEAAAQLAHQMGLDQPWYVQYLSILKSAFTFDFGYSWTSKQHILSLLKQGALASLSISLPAFVIGNGLVIATALWMTQYRKTIFDQLLVTFCVMMASLSVLVYILFGQAVFAYKLGWFEITGYENSFPGCIPYVLLPTIIGVFVYFCYHYRFYRTMMLDEIGQDYVRTAHAKGLPISLVFRRHVLRNVWIPIISGYIRDVPCLIFGSVVIENFFCIPGLGSLILDAITCCDFPTIKAATMVSTVLSVLCHMVGDLLYTLADPRVKV